MGALADSAGIKKMPTTNYSNRKVDLLISYGQTFKLGAAEEVRFSLGASAGGQICSGNIKTMQKVGIALLTYFQFYNSKWGTDLSKVMKAGSLTKAQEILETEFSTFAGKALQLLRQEEAIDDFDDERVTGITLEALSVNANLQKISLRIRISTKQGYSILILPISILL